MTNIKIFPKVYVGFQGRRAEDEIPLGFLTPYTDDAAGQKRRDTVDNWARGYGHAKTFNSIELDNEPMIGFEVGRSIRRSGGWNGSGASYVRVKDPRGFELEITIENLVMIMNDNLIDNGEIMAECVWGREGNRNILLPTNSEPYKASKQMAKSLSEVISLKEVKPGDTIKLLDGTEGVYLGGMVSLYKEPYYRRETGLKVSNKRYVMREGDKLVGRTTLKVSEIVNKVEKKLTPAEIETIVKNLVVKDLNACTDESYSSSGHVRMWTCKEKVDVQVYVEKEKTLDEVKAFENDSVLVFATGKQGQQLVLRDSGYDYGKTIGDQRQYYDYSSRQYKQVQTDGAIGIKVAHRSTNVSYNRENYSHIDLADIDKFYVFETIVKTASGVEIPILA